MKDLMSLGILTCVALVLHNIPEGMSAFAATVADPKFGFGIGFALCVHNIPEGMAVAIPIAYATQSKWKGFFVGFMSGLAEPLGALLAWSFISVFSSAIVLGCLISGVAGIMSMICVVELLPAAFRYDPTDRVTSASFLIGVATMAITLVALEFVL
eukprot:Trichotokara_eunicae@DN4589_c0_g1_i1.p1